MLNTTKSGQPINLIITKTPRSIPTGSPFKRADGLGFYIKNNGTDPVTLKVVGVDDSHAEDTTIFPGWNLEMVKEISSAVPADTNLQWGE